MRRVLLALSGQVRTLLFVAGFAWGYVGLAGWSVPLARTVAGGVLMAVALWPYLRQRKES